MDRLQPLRALGSDRGVPPVEVRRREVSHEFGARKGETKGETKGEIKKEKSCTEQENKNKQQNKQKLFSDLDGTTSTTIEESSECDAPNRKVREANEARCAKESGSGRSNETQERRLDGNVESADGESAAEATMEGSFSNKNPDHGKQPSPCDDQLADTKRAQEQRREQNERQSALESNLGRSNETQERRLDGNVESADGESAAEATMEGSFSNKNPDHGKQPSPCDDHLADTKRILRDFSLTITASGRAGHVSLDRAIAVTTSAMRRQIDRHLRNVTGKNAKKRIFKALNEHCDELVAERLAELAANNVGEDGADTGSTHDTNTDDDFAEGNGDAADQESLEDHHTNPDDDFAEGNGDAAGQESLENDWCK